MPTQNATSRLLFYGEGWLVRREQGTGKNFLPRRNRIPLQAASSGGLAAQQERPGFFPAGKGAL